MPEQWQDSLLALKPEFELGASRWPDLRCFVVVGPDSVRNEVLRDLQGRSDYQANVRCSYVVGRQFSESESSATRPDAGRELVKQLLHVLAGRRATHLRDGPSVICDERWLVGLCGDRDGADNFEMTALAAAGCYGVPDAWPFDAGIIPRPDLRRNELSTGLWIEMMFRVAWEQRTGLTLRACKFARSQGWHGAFFSVLPLNPFLASALFVNLMVIQLELQREGATAELLRQKPEIADLAGTELKSPTAGTGVQATESPQEPHREPDSAAGRLSVTDLADRYGLTGKEAEALRKRLGRWRGSHGNTEWVEIEASYRRPHDPKYLYDPKAVEPIIKAIKKRRVESSV